MAESGERKFNRSAELLALWTGLLAGPVVWLMQFQANYTLVQWVCRGGTHLVMYLVTLFALLLVACAGFLSWRLWQEAGRDWPDEEAGPRPRSRFMAVMGLITSAFFFMIIIAQAIPNLFFAPCQR